MFMMYLIHYILINMFQLLLWPSSGWLLLQEYKGTNVVSRVTITPFIPLACAECDNYLPFSGASSTPLCYKLFPATLHHQPFFYPPSLHLAICFLVYLSILLFPNSYVILFWEFYFLSFSVHAQTNVRVTKVSRPENNVLHLEFRLSNAGNKLQWNSAIT